MEQKTLAKHWWAMLIRGIVAIIFAFFAFLWTGLTLDLLLILLGIYLFLDALFAIIAAIRAIAHHKQWWLLLLEGIITLAAGIFVFTYPGMTVVILIYLIAIWAIITGLIEFLAALVAPWVTDGKVFIGIAGVISIILGIIIIMYPTISLVAMIWLLGIYALVFGLSLIIFSLKIRQA